MLYEHRVRQRVQFGVQNKKFGYLLVFYKIQVSLIVISLVNWTINTTDTLTLGCKALTTHVAYVLIHTIFHA